MGLILLLNEYVDDEVDIFVRYLDFCYKLEKSDHLITGVHFHWLSTTKFGAESASNKRSVTLIQTTIYPTCHLFFHIISSYSNMK